jgi:uncharacterized protein (TIGR01244 family)
MLRLAFAALSGGIMGLGLLISGMTDTAVVQAWLDVFGAWDPTLAFVMGGAIVPMAAAWLIANRRGVSMLGTAIPARSTTGIERTLVIGSILFGAGWALAGLCPGPSVAVLGFGGWQAALFFVAMVAGMLAAPTIRARLSSPSSRVTPDMDIRSLSDRYAVSPQIRPEDVAAIRDAGFTRIVCNRPDAEIPPGVQAADIRKAAEAAGLDFVFNPVIGGALTEANVAAQAEAMATAKGPVFAYCASGNRSSIVWALANAASRSADDLIGTAAKWGYNLEPYRAAMDARKAG